MKKLTLRRETLQLLQGEPLGKVAGGMNMSRRGTVCYRTENGCGGITVDICGDSMVNCTQNCESLACLSAAC